MGIRVVLFCAIASVMAVSILIVADLGNKKLEEDDVMVYTLINSHGIDKEVADEAVENLNFHVLKKKFGIWKDVKHAIVDSLENKNPPVQFSGDDRVLRNRFNLFLELVNITPTRRILIQSVAGAPTQSPTISPTPAPSVKEPPRTSSSPSFFLADSTGPIDVKQSSSGPVSSGLELKKKKNSNKTVLIAVLVTAGSTFVVSVILLLCWRKFCGSGSITGRNDDRPLLGLSLSDYSHAYSKISSFELNSTGNFEKKDSIQMFGIDSAINIPFGTVVGDVMVSSDNSVYNKMSANGLFPLKPPPGRANSTISTVVVPEKGASSAPPPPPPPRPIAPLPPMPPSIPSKTSFAGPRPPPLPPRAAPVGSSKTAPHSPRPPPPTGGLKPPGPSAPSSSSSKGGEDETDVHKAKLKPFFWDKVLANPKQSMVWHQIKSGSFQFMCGTPLIDEEMIETLFGYAPAAKTNDQSKNSSSLEPSNQYIQLLEPKKSQNISILLKALNVIIEEVVDALQEGHELPSELIQTLLKMGPTIDEELKLRLYSGDLSRLGPAERFLKHLVDLPFSFKKLEALHFMCTLKDEEKILKESFSILESACNELRKSRLFLKLLEAVLKTGNRMNNGTFRGGAEAFKLDTLLKLSDVKGVDGKTTLLHFVVQEIIRSEGVRAVRVARENLSMSGVTSDDNIHEDSSHETEEHYRTIGLQVVSGLCNELENVKRAAALDSDSISGSVLKLGHELIKARDLLNSELKNVDKESGFYQTLTSFVQNADVDIGWLLVEEKRIMGLVKNTGDYFHGNSAKDEGLRLFIVVRDFLIILEKVCKEVKVAPNKPPSKAAQTMVAPSKQPLPPPPPPPDPDHRQLIIPALKQQRRMGDYSSDDDSP